MFARPSRQLPGKWRLFEYYSENSGQLVNISEDELKKQGAVWKIEFGDGGVIFDETAGLHDFSGFSGASEWILNKNYITFIYPETGNEKREFQFAVEKDVLKLLKKDETGKIEFFGFFRKLPAV